MPRLHQMHVARIQVVSTCIACYRLHVSCIGNKIVVNAAHVSTCIRIQVARPGYLYPATCRLSGVNAASVIFVVNAVNAVQYCNFIYRTRVTKAKSL